MCTLCAAIAPLSPACVLGSADPVPPYAEIIEGRDAQASNDSGQLYTLEPGDSFSGTLESVGDRDWVRITLEEGEAYEISLTGGTLEDPYLRIYDADENFITGNDDIIPGIERDSYLEFAPLSGGVYYIEAGAWEDDYTGSYALRIGNAQTPIPRPGPGTFDEMADFLTDGYWGAGNAHSFDTSGDTEITVNLDRLNGDGRQLARWAFEAWETIADIEFVETGGSADITFDDGESGASAYASAEWDGNGNTISADVMITTGWLDRYGTELESYSFSTYVHEIGHALGLGHQGAYNGFATFGYDETFANDSWQLSVMSYFNQTENPNVDAAYGELVTPMMIDIIAIQNLYGAPGSNSLTSGDTIWGPNSNIDGYMGVLLDALAGISPPEGYLSSTVDLAFTIYDQGGIDTIDVSFSEVDNYLSMVGGTFSDVDGQDGNVGVARGTVLEHAIGGEANDTVIGNAADNNILGGTGDDEIYGAAGNDTLDGEGGDDLLGAGAGDDRLFGGAGEDRLFGGAGNDTLEGGNAADILGGAGGDDAMDGGAGFDQIWGGAGNDTMSGGGDNDTLGGSVGDDSLSGGAGNDELWGAADNDTLDGGTGNDILGGYYGDDVLLGGAGDDALWGAWGDDTLEGEDGDDQLGAADGDDSLTGGAGEDTLSGGRGADTLNGGDDDDELYGFTGDDIINGGAGNDILYGGAGADSFEFATGFGNDDVFGFSIAAGDRLALDDAMWSDSLTTRQVVDQFAGLDALSNNVVFAFGVDTFELFGVTTTDGLSGALDIV